MTSEQDAQLIVAEGVPAQELRSKWAGEEEWRPAVQMAPRGCFVSDVKEENLTWKAKEMAF